MYTDIEDMELPLLSGTKKVKDIEDIDDNFRQIQEEISTENDDDYDPYEFLENDGFFTLDDDEEVEKWLKRGRTSVKVVLYR